VTNLGVRHLWNITAAEAEGCIGGGGEYKVSEAVKAVRSCQNSLGQDGTRLGILLLLVGPNGDGFGGQAFMEHYSVIIRQTGEGIKGETVHSYRHRSGEDQLLIKCNPVGIVVIRHGQTDYRNPLHLTFLLYP
jgi:hypothetical protein